ncbi:hypothetical protein HNY73_004105 [Argiope bruennichi]|uniref:Uncharacterized protein n=1 Tax=Argiope bruennichi TaxID=94029 RepID=A0A8T0FN78_ARGBR|nr:hypothetical protein HNY73_004105 [Argiope bruennichi]
MKICAIILAVICAMLLLTGTEAAPAPKRHGYHHHRPHHGHYPPHHGHYPPHHGHHGRPYPHRPHYG